MIQIWYQHSVMSVRPGRGGGAGGIGGKLLYPEAMIRSTVWHRVAGHVVLLIFTGKWFLTNLLVREGAGRWGGAEDESIDMEDESTDMDYEQLSTNMSSMIVKQ